MLASDIYRETKLSKLYILQLYIPPFTTQLSKYSLGGWGSANCHTETIGTGLLEDHPEWRGSYLNAVAVFYRKCRAIDLEEPHLTCCKSSQAHMQEFM